MAYRIGREFYVVRDVNSLICRASIRTSDKNSQGIKLLVSHLDRSDWNQESWMVANFRNYSSVNFTEIPSTVCEWKEVVVPRCNHLPFRWKKKPCR